jgi:drug/metabolite transporter (DMT)-like permease
VEAGATMTQRGWLLFAAMCVIWGIPYLMIRVAVRELTPATLVFGRTALGALLLVPAAAWRRELRPLLRVWWPLLLYTVIEIGVPWLLLARAETKLTSSLTGLLVAGVPLVGAVLVRLTGDRERMGARRWSGLFVGLLGVGALVGLDPGSITALPVAEVCTVAVCYAIGPLILARSLADSPPLGVVAASLGLAALVYLPIGLIQAPEAMPRLSVCPSSGWASSAPRSGS